MTALEIYFPKIFCINLERRLDRRKHAEAQFQKLRIPLDEVNWFSAYDAKEYNLSGMELCTLSHQAILHMAAHYRWPRTLIFEDDFEIRDAESKCQNPLTAHPQVLFAKMASEIPADWEVLYLGAQYESEPRAKISEHIIQPDRVLCTSSYAVTWQMARKIAPHFHCGAPDTILSNMVSEKKLKAYVVKPRLFRQWNNFSDLEGRETQGNAMDDIRHENMVE